MTWSRSLLLVVALLASGLSAPVIRYAATTPLAVVAWRVLLACPPMFAVGAARRGSWALGRAIPAGAFLAVYWVLGVMAIQLTTVACASVLLCTGALWAAVLSRPLLGERVSGRHWLGLVVALGGVAAICSTGDDGRHSVAGNLCALGASASWVGYTFIGRRARRDAEFWGYSAALYTAAGVVVVVAAYTRGESITTHSPTTWLALAALALLPTLLGHGALNYLLRFVEPSKLSLWMLSKPVTAAVLAWFLFSELPTPRVLAGGAAILGGIALGIAPRPRVASEKEPS